MQSIRNTLRYICHCHEIWEALEFIYGKFEDICKESSEPITQHLWKQFRFIEFALLSPFHATGLFLCPLKPLVL